MESIHNFVISRAKISRSSVKVNDLFFTYNGENLKEDLNDVAKVANEKFSDLNDLNGATMTSLIHLFNEDEIKTCYFMCAMSLIGKIDDKEFKLDFSSKRGNFLTVKSVIVEPKNDVNEKNTPEEPKNEDPKDVVGDENAPEDVPEEPKDVDVVGGEVNDENVPEEPKNEEESDKSEETSEEPKDDKKKVKDDKKKKAAKDASDKL